ncbi:uncharacterized protein VTP21DRAFT_5658 [Calcarisporiella thermophila]|uniref:uncharacterized protein n=1 Tax=Calcarisporiella thermophila TaxID=911321 RepID=UPI0037442F39
MLRDNWFLYGEPAYNPQRKGGFWFNQFQTWRMLGVPVNHRRGPTNGGAKTPNTAIPPQ